MYHPTENNYSNDKILVHVDKVKINTNDNIELLGPIIQYCHLY